MARMSATPVALGLVALLPGLLFGAAPASAQAALKLASQGTLPDGRVVKAYAVSDGSGYRVEVAGALWSGVGDGLPLELTVGDVDQDGAADVAILMAAHEPGLRRAEVWDVTTQGPVLMYISESLPAAESAIAALQLEATQQLSAANAVGVLQYASESVERGGDIDPATLRSQVSSWLTTARAALLQSEVARARAVAKAAKPQEQGSALAELRLALQARAKFAGAASEEFLKAQRSAAVAALTPVSTPEPAPVAPAPLDAPGSITGPADGATAPVTAEAYPTPPSPEVAIATP